MGRHDLSAKPVDGPAIIEEDSSLTVVIPNWKASLDEWSNILLEPK
jgi:N-methylhydantoinase A/oxoprolinase/acetone carboxylase beta subunit